MDKKIYTAPSAQPILFAPAENIAESNWTWQWGTWKSLYQNTPVSAVEGYGEIWPKPWEYDSTSDPY